MNQENIKNRLAKVVGAIRSVIRVKLIIIIVLIVLIITFLIGSFQVIIVKDTASYKKGDKSNVPNNFKTYSSNINISNVGDITSETNAQELWNNIIKNGGNINEYLSTPSELKKLMNAELVTQFIDTRENVDKEYDWNKINDDVENADIHGIVKLKRANADGSINNMTYVDEGQYNFYIQEYLSKGTEEAKKEALSHYTLGINKTGNYNSDSNLSGVSSISSSEFLKAVQEVAAEVYQNRSSYKYGHSTTTPPCELESDGKKHISCDRIASRALYNLGFTDQPAGGITCLTPGVDTWLESHGFIRINDQTQLQRWRYSFYRNP